MVGTSSLGSCCMAIDIGRIPVNGAVICEVEHYAMSPTSSLDCWFFKQKHTDMNI